MHKCTISFLFVAMLLGIVACSEKPLKLKDDEVEVEDEIKISHFGEYKGYSEKLYDSHVRESIYVPVKDGTRLAVDIYHPANGGVKTAARHPVIVIDTRYYRATMTPEGHLVTPFDGDSSEKFLLEHGYVVVVFDRRGTGASFGYMIDQGSLPQGRDAADIIAWVAAQPWSTGKVGMIGGSSLGFAQLVAAAAHPPALKAVFPRAVEFDMVEQLVNGGATTLAPVEYFNATAAMDGQKVKGQITKSHRKRLKDRVAPVDGPDGEALRTLAIADHKLPDEKASVYKGLTAESWSKMMAYAWAKKDVAEEYSPSPVFFMPELNSSGVAFYISVGWYDMFARSPLRWFANLSAPKKVMIGPWTHSPNKDERYSDAHRVTEMVEQLRWFDYWLKDIDNGIMNEPGLTYAVIDKEVNRFAWRAVDQLPDPLVQQKTFFLGQNGVEQTLMVEKATKEVSATFTVDYTATTGNKTRHYDSLGMGPLNYPEMSELNSKGLVYTTAPLTKDIALLGYPVIQLNVTSTADDALVSVYLEKVLADGQSIFVTEGVLKASHRVLKKAPYNNLGLPLSDSSKDVVDATPPLNAGIATLEFTLMPSGMLFEKGSRIRIAITGADVDNYIQSPLSPAPDITVFSGGTHISNITLPMIEDISVLDFREWVDPR